MAEEAPVRHPGLDLTGETRFALSVGLRQRGWPGESVEVVYVPQIRSTVLVDASAGTVLRVLADLGGSGTPREILAALDDPASSASQEAGADDELLLLHAQLVALADHGLIASRQEPHHADAA